MTNSIVRHIFAERDEIDVCEFGHIFKYADGSPSPICRDCFVRDPNWTTIFPSKPYFEAPCAIQEIVWEQGSLCYRWLSRAGEDICIPLGEMDCDIQEFTEKMHKWVHPGPGYVVRRVLYDHPKGGKTMREWSDDQMIRWVDMPLDPSRSVV